jgi:hypothetical protein
MRIRNAVTTGLHVFLAYAVGIPLVLLARLWRVVIRLATPDGSKPGTGRPPR